MNEVFERYSAYYDLLYQDKDYQGEADYIARALRAANPKAKTILEFGSGTGKHGRLLAERGFEVFGIERSESMVAAAKIDKRNAGGFECIQGDLQATDVGRTFDAVVALFHVISYQTSDSEVRRTFSNAARHLLPGGIFLFDVWHGPAVLHVRPSLREKHVENESVRLTRIADPELDRESKIVTVRYSMVATSKNDNERTTFGEEHRMRYFFPEEIKAFAEEAGFAVERSEEFFTSREPSDQTWGVAYLLVKPHLDK
jgi:SAM-dependent methyltransferase